jgi:hypothetical protein
MKIYVYSGKKATVICTHSLMTQITKLLPLPLLGRKFFLVLKFSSISSRLLLLFILQNPFHSISFSLYKFYNFIPFANGWRKRDKSECFLYISFAVMLIVGASSLFTIFTDVRIFVWMVLKAKLFETESIWAALRSYLASALKVYRIFWRIQLINWFTSHSSLKVSLFLTGTFFSSDYNLLSRHLYSISSVIGNCTIPNFSVWQENTTKF